MYPAQHRIDNSDSITIVPSGVHSSMELECELILEKEAKTEFVGLFANRLHENERRQDFSK